MGGGRGDGAGPVSAGGVVQLAGHGCRRWQLLAVLAIGAERDSRSDSVCSAADHSVVLTAPQKFVAKSTLTHRQNNSRLDKQNL